MLNQPSYIAKNSESDEKRNISSDKLLWNSFKEGSRKSFHYIYDQNFERLLSYGLKFSADQSMVEDQIQELFIYLWQKKENLDIHSSITVYLLWSLRNRIIKYTKSIKEYALEDENLSIDDANDSLDHQKFEDLSEAINLLPPKQREAITLKYYQNLDGEEIARIMDVTIGSIYNLLSRAIANLRESISIPIIFTFLNVY